MVTEKLVLNPERNVTVTALLQSGTCESSSKRYPVMVVLPGGGYTMCSPREAEPVAEEYVKAGCQALVLRYTVADTAKEPIETCWPLPLEDYEALLVLMQEKAAEWCLDLDNVAVCGFSAGAHLAQMVGCKASKRPKLLVLGYPVVLQTACDICVPDLPLPLEHIDPKTPPCFIFQAQDDSMVPPENSYALARALGEHGILYELHMYSKGEHGFTTGREDLLIAPACSRIPNWIPDSLAFWKEL